LYADRTSLLTGVTENSHTQSGQNVCRPDCVWLFLCRPLTHCLSMALFIHREHSDRGCIAMNDIADRPTARSLRHRRRGRIARHTINVATANNLAESPPTRRHHQASTSLVTPTFLSCVPEPKSTARWRTCRRRCGGQQTDAPTADGRGPTLLCRPVGLPSVPSMPLPLLTAGSLVGPGTSRFPGPPRPPTSSSFASRISSSAFRKWTTAAGRCSEYDFDVVTSDDDGRRRASAAADDGRQPDGRPAAPRTDTDGKHAGT